jgi:membrane-bound lytic murein transglycosylase A
MMIARAVVFACVALLSLPAVASGSTVHGQAGLSVTPMSFMRLAGWQEDDHSPALQAFRRSCTKLTVIPDDSTIGSGLLAAKARHWHKPCLAAAAIDLQDRIGARVFFEREFVPYQLAYDGDPRGKFTGYYEPLMRGSWERRSSQQEPIYAPPADLVNGQVYPLTRSQIDNGALSGKGLEVMYIDDPVDAFFLHVQGSGRVLMDTGEMVALRYAGKTNQPYTAIGKILVQSGQLSKEEVSAPTIRQWLHDNPTQMRELMQHNASYIFFSAAADAGDGPVGAQNVPLIAERSLAVDAAFIPLGMPLWLSTHLPKSQTAGGEAYERLMVAQDKGSAITGAIRGDVFFGFGERAADLAGHMNSEGTLTALIPKGLARDIEGRRF